MAARVLLVLAGVLFLAFAWLYAQLPKSSGDRLEASPTIVGVLSGGAYAWILRTPNGAALIDTGIDAAAEPILRELQAMGLSDNSVHTIVITHGHPDHTGGAARFSKAKVWAGPGESSLIRGERAPASTMASLMRRFHRAPAPPAAIEEAADGQAIDADGEKLQVIHVPGHTAGSIMVLRGELLFTGDSLARKGKGVGMLPSIFHEDEELHRRSLQKLLPLPFSRIADGHTGITEDARQKLRRYLDQDD